MYYKNQISKDFENAKYSYNAQVQKLTIVYRDKGETETMIADVTMLTKSKFQYRWVDYEDEMDLYSFTKIDES